MLPPGTIHRRHRQAPAAQLLLNEFAAPRSDRVPETMEKKQGTYGKMTLELSFNDNEPLRKYGAYHGIQGSDNVTPKSCLACF